ncbi:hypothetical protein MP638_005790 [Amoeboaphelidium occidentale]|nr:hypothetical protein MP638_005790 [Amoeboaphelidium occidentale]
MARRLEVFAGPTADQLKPCVLNNPGHAVHIKSPVFDGKINVHIDFPDQLIVEPQKNFSIQVEGRFLPLESYDRSSGVEVKKLWTFDDVMFGVELDRPISWSKIPLPTIMAKGIYHWLRRSNSEIQIDNLFYDDTGKVGDPYLHHDPFFHLFGTSMLQRPSIMTPIVCGASTLNVYPYSDSSGDEYLRSGVDYYAKFVGFDQAAIRRRLEWNLISQKRPVWVYGPYYNRAHSFQRELVEYNDFIFLPATIATPRSNLDRREYLREKHLASKRSQLNYVRAPDGITGLLRRQYFFDPALTYCFEFHANYFDFTTFVLRPRLSGAGMPRGMSNFVCGRLAFETGPHIIVRETSSEITSRVTIACKARKSFYFEHDVYFWCVVFELTVPKQGYAPAPVPLY